jgi:hypothetical protein
MFKPDKNSNKIYIILNYPLEKLPNMINNINL